MFIYIIFVSRFKVMIVRNLLYILPFFAIFASIGFDYLSNRLQKYKLSYALKVIILLILFYSCSNVISASYNIKNKSDINLASELEKYIEQNKDKEFIFSSGVSSLLKHGINNNIKITDHSYFVFFKNEISYKIYKANINNQFTKIIGVDDVNFDYYPTWSGLDRIVVMKYSNVSDDMLLYSLKGITRKLTFDAENLTADSSGFLSTEFTNDTLVNNKSSSILSSLILSKRVDNRSDEEAHSGKYSVKLDKSKPYGFVCKLKVKMGSYYKFSVWRKNPEHTGFLVVGENNFFNRAWFAYGADNNGWELLYFDYLCDDNTIQELPVYVWQDTLSSVYFDDLTITSVEKPE